MARRQVFMNEVVEIIYQWHQRGSLKAMARSLGVDRDTVRKYVRLGQQAGVQRGQPFPEEGKLVRRLEGVQGSWGSRETPAQDLIAPHRDWIVSLLEKEKIEAKQVWRLFLEKTGLRIGYCTMKRYLKTQRNPWGSPPFRPSENRTAPRQFFNPIWCNHRRHKQKE